MSSDNSKFEWYEIVADADISQGDFLNKFPIIVQPLDMPLEPKEDDEIIPDLEFHQVVVMTQSCDFQKMSETDLVTLCPRSNFSDLYGHEADKGKGKWKPLIEGRIVDAHLLSNCNIAGHEFDYQIVTLSKIFSVPYGYIKRFTEMQQRRVRLLPPYREHLAQAFAKRFMRVGLPIDLPREFPYK